MTNKQFSHLVKKLYVVPCYVNEILQIPLVDMPVTALQSFGLLSEDGQGMVYDLLDRKAEMAF